MSQPTISVVIPTYNHEEFVEQALSSVYDQDYEDVELIVIDDCSRDETFRVAQRFLSRRSVRQRFRTVHFDRNATNRGAHETIGAGLSLASGRYLAILNSDDYFATDRLTKLSAALTESGGLLAFSKTAYVDETGRSVADSEFLLPTELAARARANLPTIGFGFLRNNIAISTGNFFFDRHLLDIVGGFLPLKYCHDWDFALQSIRFAEPVYVDEPLYFYRVHGSNSFRELSDQAISETQIVLSRYFKAVVSGQIQNDVAPSPANWPGIFQACIRHFELEELWHRAESGHPSRSRMLQELTRPASQPKRLGL